jgi:hypothetical protein
MSMQLQGRVSALEAEVKALRELVESLAAAPTETHEPKQITNPNGPRRMCPKCGVKPNYHLHVINCRGPWQGDGAAP